MHPPFHPNPSAWKGLTWSPSRWKGATGQAGAPIADPPGWGPHRRGSWLIVPEAPATTRLIHPARPICGAAGAGNPTAFGEDPAWAFHVWGDGTVSRSTSINGCDRIGRYRLGLGTGPTSTGTLLEPGWITRTGGLSRRGRALHREIAAPGPGWITVILPCSDLQSGEPAKAVKPEEAEGAISVVMLQGGRARR